MIRKATKNDIFAINKLGSKLHANFIKTYHIETEIDNDLAIVLVAEEKNEIVGYLYAQNFVDNIDLLSIYIDEEYRLKQYGYNLICKLQSLYNNKTITLEVSNSNTKALNLYEKCGFKRIAIRKKYYQNSDAIIMKWGI